jgi:putative nucleotidyltransferase with HDIG domain
MATRPKTCTQDVRLQSFAWAESFQMALPGGNYTLTLTLEPLVQNVGAQKPGLLTLDDLPDLFTHLLDSLAPGMSQVMTPASPKHRRASRSRGNGNDEIHVQLLHQSTKITKARQGAFFQLDRKTGHLHLLASLDDQEVPAIYWDAAQEVALKAAPLLYHFPGFSFEARLLAVPVEQHGLLCGVLIVGDRAERPLDQDDLNLVAMLGSNLALVSENLAQQERNTVYLLESIKALVKSLEARDPYTGQHSARVTEIVLHFGRHLGLPSENLESLKTASYVHDIGKVGISDFILLKPGALTPEERAIIQSHPIIGGRIVEPLGLQPHEKSIIINHHERWDGRGYPHGLRGEEIPLLCRLLTLADTFDALTTDRPYRRRFSIPQALSEIRAHAGTQFDPELAAAFVDMMSCQTA